MFLVDTLRNSAQDQEVLADLNPTKITVTLRI